jgi:hypothetical protein
MKIRIESPSALRVDGSILAGRMQDPPVAAVPLDVEHQQRTNWCWAAIAVSLARHYGTGAFTQDEVAAGVFGIMGSNAAHAVDDRANSVALLDDALRFVGCHASWTPGRPVLADIARELAGKRPPCVCLEWSSGDAHYVVVTGCVGSSGELTIGDPLHGTSMQLFHAFPATYRSAGAVWRGVYWTGPGNRDLPAQPGMRARGA